MNDVAKTIAIKSEDVDKKDIEILSKEDASLQAKEAIHKYFIIFYKTISKSTSKKKTLHHESQKKFQSIFVKKLQDSKMTIVSNSKADTKSHLKCQQKIL